MKHGRNSFGSAARLPRAVDRALFSRSDLTTALSLPLYAALAWTLPERAWPTAAAALGALSNRAAVARLTTRIRRAAPDMPPNRAKQVSDRLNAGRIEHNFQVLRCYRPGGWRPDLRLEGQARLEAAVDGGRGAVLWIGHFVFNGLAPKMALDRAGHAVTHLSRPEHGFSKTRLGIACLNPVRVRAERRFLAGRILIERGAEERATRAAIATLKRGGIVSITAGAWEGRRRIPIRTGGGVVPLSTGGAAIARLAGAPLLPVFTIRDGVTFRVIVGAPIEPGPSGPKSEQIEAMCHAYARQLAVHVSAAPDQWRGWTYLEPRGPDGEP